MASGKQLLVEIERELLDRNFNQPMVVLEVARSPRGKMVMAQVADADGRRLYRSPDEYAHANDLSAALRELHRIVKEG